MKAVSRVHITPHMHWDREWYFTTEESRILLVNNMEDILCRLEQDNEYKYYVLDGQTAILEDYFAVKPENKDRVKKLVEAGKLIIGPWYTQTDTTIVSAESIVRNLMYGMRDCLAFGEPMKIGYLPDSFGMSGQLPHIYNGFGITRTMFWRGCSERHGTDKTEFLWQSSDGSEVTAQVMPLGYAIGKYLPADENGLRKRLDSYFDVLEKASVTKEILLPNGHDQMPLQQNIFEVMEKLREIYPQRKFVMSRFQINQIVPSMGYRTLYIEANQPGNVIAAKSDAEGILENAFWQIALNEDGTLQLVDKDSGVRYDRVLQIEEGSDDGDEYDYSPAKEEWVMTSATAKPQCEITHEAWQSRAVIRYDMAVPLNLLERSVRQSTGRVGVEMVVTLSHNSRRIDVDINLDNQADDHRLRVLVPTPFNTDSVLADTQFGSLTRPVNDSAMNDWQQEGWKEAPVPVWNMLNYAALQEGRNGMAVFSEGLREFEVIGEEKKTFAITLLRGVGLLGKEDLLLRPGRPSGIKMPVPDSQLRGLLSCRLSLLSYTGTPTAAGVAQQARACLTPVQCYNKIPWDAMKLNKAGFNVPESYSLLKMPPVGCLISALKKAEDRQEVILRLFNPAESATCDATVAFSREVISCSETMMDEHITTEENQGSNL
ncbi:glycoside hydrolase family 38 C-terminal domain-containing protein [Shigella boydii]|uniref:glycoside hydrolase family 38 N-terminal domain-containing protein n=1 Tax=Shigella boydii TaxID=621 RepID=UPI00020A531D|nr:glycoside hydrolase family 38 C-terminal domain-containing protein [Shigella boydii]EGI98846.1 glycosyl hydrolases family 38 C-terminal domain protein [Shigella boydii 5216-82]EGO9719270.1 hypothetical protein [Escherichia coli]